MIQHAARHPEVQQSLCRGCHRCAKECGSDAITCDANNKAVIDQTKCKGCGRCIGACNFDAIYSPVSYTHLDVYKRQGLQCQHERSLC